MDRLQVARRVDASVCSRAFVPRADAAVTAFLILRVARLFALYVAAAAPGSRGAFVLLAQAHQ